MYAVMPFIVYVAAFIGRLSHWFVIRSAVLFIVCWNSDIRCGCSCCDRLT